MIKPATDDRRAMLGVALRAFTQVSRAWSLTGLEQAAILGQPVDSAFAALNATPDCVGWTETIERVSYVLGIYRALHTIFRSQRQADQWIRLSNSAPLFKGHTALSLMCSGSIADLASVREYLDSQGLAGD